MKEQVFDMLNNQPEETTLKANSDPAVQNVEQVSAPAARAAALVTAVDRVLGILETFHRVQKPLSLTDLAELAGIPKSSCHAIVGTLTARGYLYSLTRPRALYPTRRLYDIAHGIQENDPFVERAMPLLERLRDSSRETVILGKRQGDAVIYLQVVESTNAIRYSAKSGEFKPLHSSSIGKALLGSLKEAEMRAQIGRLATPAITDHTLTAPEDLEHDILEGRRRGYYVTRGENVADVWAVAASFTFNSETLAIAIAGPRHRMESSVGEYAQLLSAACSVISRQWARS